jgi:hypothetical protein
VGCGRNQANPHGQNRAQATGEGNEMRLPKYITSGPDL